MEAIALVNVDRRCADQLGQFAGRLTANQVHLKEAVLTMNVARSKSQVFAVRRRNYGYTVRVPFDRNAAGQPSNADCAVKLREAGPQAKPYDSGENDDKACRPAREPEQQALHC
jgi:hypothetical protein